MQSYHKCVFTLVLSVDSVDNIEAGLLHEYTESRIQTFYPKCAVQQVALVVNFEVYVKCSRRDDRLKGAPAMGEGKQWALSPGTTSRQGAEVKLACTGIVATMILREAMAGIRLVWKVDVSPVQFCICIFFFFWNIFESLLTKVLSVVA